ncbi:hypothetical protein AVEN_69675-1 [Araneus ventricosus]|uniref:Uncharacterized protein n=1 Tax=Araneus ventricosus TaxID=182803 RepID=A0A4Y2JN04_ARAVE|nr:hypothetical protein AVEN_69675-1 [Araneus ventricosus]
MEQSSASFENFYISLDFTPHEDANLRQIIEINFSFSGHISVNSPIPGISTSETTVSPEVVQSYPKALLRITKEFRKIAKPTSLTSTQEKKLKKSH